MGHQNENDCMLFDGVFQIFTVLVNTYHPRDNPRSSSC